MRKLHKPIAYISTDTKFQFAKNCLSNCWLSAATNRFFLNDYEIFNFSIVSSSFACLIVVQLLLFGVPKIIFHQCDAL